MSGRVNMQLAARLLLKQAEKNGWYMVVNTDLATRSAIAAWKAVKAASDDVHVVFFDRNRRLGSAFLSAGDATILGYTQHGAVAVTVDKIVLP
jgi:hypothetical protein